MESTKAKRVWHDGPPPHIGWWNASVNRSKHVWRWWNGEAWGLPASHAASCGHIRRAYDADQPAQCQADIQWTDYWPKNARVPRMRPEDFETAAPWIDPNTGYRWVVAKSQPFAGRLRLHFAGPRVVVVDAAVENLGIAFVPERCYAPKVAVLPGLRATYFGVPDAVREFGKCPAQRQEAVDSRVLAAFGTPAGYAPPRKVSHWAGLSSNEPCPLAGLPTTAFGEVV